MSENNDEKENNCCKHCPEKDSESTSSGSTGFVTAVFITILVCILVAITADYRQGLPPIKDLFSGVFVIFMFIWVIVSAAR